ncbi:hypothetical protein MMC13_002303 [Lambiella insularis]|nr:hypothetical protein [Lambiella insularis]
MLSKTAIQAFSHPFSQVGKPGGLPVSSAIVAAPSGTYTATVLLTSGTPTTNVTTSSPISWKGGRLLACKGLGQGVQNLGLSWGYGWIPNPEAAFTDEGLATPLDMDLVPQIYTVDQATSGTFNTIKSNSNNKEILGFNEPDVNKESYTDCANVWPQVVATGLRVGSPAPATPPSSPATGLSSSWPPSPPQAPTSTSLPSTPTASGSPM